jgi:hypothetical protein
MGKFSRFNIFYPIIERLDKILMAFADILAQLQADSASNATALAGLSADVTALVAAFQANAGGAPTQAQLDALTAVDTGLQQASASAAASAAAIKAVDPSAP